MICAPPTPPHPPYTHTHIPSYPQAPVYVYQRIFVFFFTSMEAGVRMLVPLIHTFGLASASIVNTHHHHHQNSHSYEFKTEEGTCCFCDSP